MFALHQQLEQDTFFITDLQLCRVLLMNNENFPWLILVPRIAGASEIIDLPPSERSILIEEIAFISDKLKTLFSAYKLNVAALGNQVAQLHIHIIARFKEDVAWPSPVWQAPRSLYNEPTLLIQKIQQAIA